MPTLSSSIASDPVKLLIVGHSGAGKTAALISLVEAGYKLRILDFDNGLEFLAQLVMAKCPDKISNISYMSFRDTMKAGPAGMIVKGTPKAFPNAVNALDKWEDGTPASSWGQDTVIVVDSLTRMGRAALAWAKQMNPGFKDPRLWYAPAQGAVEDVIANLTGEDIKANVVVITHIDVREDVDERGKVTGSDSFPSSVGKALGPKIPQYFNTILVAETVGSGQNTKRQFRTYPTGELSWVKVPKLNVGATYPIDTGLKTLFDQLRG